VLNLGLLATGVFAIAAFLLAPVLVPLMAPGLGEDTGRQLELTDLAVKLTRIMLVSPVLFAISGMFVVLLQRGSRRRFDRPDRERAALLRTCHSRPRRDRDPQSRLLRAVRHAHAGHVRRRRHGREPLPGRVTGRPWELEGVALALSVATTLGALLLFYRLADRVPELLGDGLPVALLRMVNAGGLRSSP
jgi:peptidoglycan biosynthesis protein MviN/MurJ (putative lipid II flippase)